MQAKKRGFAGREQSYSLARNIENRTDQPFDLRWGRESRNEIEPLMLIEE